MRKLSLGLGLIVLLLAIVLAGCNPPEPTISPLATLSIVETPQISEAAVDWPEGKVLYHANTGGGNAFQIYLVEDGGEPRLLTSGLSNAVGADWSPDGQKIAFSAYTSDSTNAKIYTMLADGSDLKALTFDQPRLNWRPSWSADGTQLIFISNRDSNFEIYKGSEDGNFMANITVLPNSNQGDPDWSPDGSQIVFISDGEGIDGLYLMDSNGENVQELVEPSWDCSFPRWSPDGEKIAFTARPEGGSDHIFVINADGSDFRQVEKRNLDSIAPAWVGNDRLIFSGDMGDTHWDLYIINLDGSELGQLTDTLYSERLPKWYP